MTVWRGVKPCASGDRSTKITLFTRLWVEEAQAPGARERKDGSRSAATPAQPRATPLPSQGQGVRSVSPCATVHRPPPSAPCIIRP